jgi:hypothetical protein
MICNNAKVKLNNGIYVIELPIEKQEEKAKVLKYALEHHGGFFHIEISKVKKPKSLDINSLFHGLLTIYYLSGLHSCDSWQGLKNQLKYQFGAGFKEGSFKMPDGTEYRELKSVSDYGMDEMIPLVDGTIKDMIIVGVDEPLFFEILDTINYNAGQTVKSAVLTKELLKTIHGITHRRK